MAVRQKKWSDQAIREEATKYATVEDFAEGNFPAYWSAIKTGILAEIYPDIANDQDTSRQWSLLAIQTAAKQCRTRTEFHDTYPGAYAAATRLGIMEEVSTHMTFHTREKSPSVLSNEELIGLVDGFNSSHDFLRANPSAYTQIVKRGLFKTICELYGWAA